MDELLEEFIAETRETLAALEGEIVAWEADPGDRARLDAIFRFVHTVKGSCGFLDLPRLARLSHHAEDVLAAVRDGRRAADGRLVDAVLAIVDRIGEIVEALDAGHEIEAEGDELLIAALSENPVSAPAAEDDDEIEAAAAPVKSSTVPRAPQRSVRLPVDLLDRMMSGMSDMVLARNELARKLRDGDADPVAEAALERLSLIVADMRDTVGRTRMQAIEALFSALPRMVRDTASQLGKQVNLTIEGGDVEIDREMIEAMRDPLVHIIRNAIDHGIEAPALREAAGKPAAGHLTVAARQSGNTIVIEVSDDGAGIDIGRLVAKYAGVQGRDVAEFRGLSEKARAELVFEPGLSSRDEVSQISGRGVGMDVVRANVEQIGGRIELDNAPGQGLVITIHVPLTLSILPTIVLGAGGQRFALARQSVEEIVTADGETVRIDELGGTQVATVRGELMALVRLPETLGLEANDIGDRPMLAIVTVPGGHYALAVDSVIDSEELVVKPASPAIMACGLFAGQTLPDTGVPMLVLDGAGIATARGISFTRDRNPLNEAAAELVETGLECLLFVDSDGVRRALPLIAVDRLEEVDRGAIGFSGGRMRLTLDGAIVPVVARAALPDQGRVRLVRIRLGDRELAYAVTETIEIIRLGGDWADAPASEGLLGIALHEGAPVEIVDAGALMSGDEDAGGARPVCVLAGAGQQWMAGFLAPVLERAGYRVAIVPPAGEQVTVLAMSGDDVDVPSGGAVVRLAERPGEGGVYRYDRQAVLAAVAGAGR